MSKLPPDYGRRRPPLVERRPSVIGTIIIVVLGVAFAAFLLWVLLVW